MKTPNPDIPNIAANHPELAAQLSSGPARPIVLFPVRLETRFFLLAEGGAELRVRVYPDKIHIDAHEPALTPEELSWGKHFWEQTWRAATDEERAKAAWRQLVDRFDAPRAAWIARTLKPGNPDDRPKNPVAADAVLTDPPQFPSPDTQLEPWMRAPLTRALPNFWIVLGYKNGQLVINKKGGPIREPLAGGPNPLPTAVVDEAGIDQGMKWMVDFNAAEEVGMGIRAKLTIDQAAMGLDFLLVMGIKDSAGATTDLTPDLVQLFNAHHYNSGISFVPPGTATNNTAESPSGFSSEDPGHEASYLAERTGTPFKSGDLSNADVLTTALGLTNAGGIFGTLTHAAEKDQVDALAMNTALWQATWGYFLLQMLGVGRTGESPLNDADIAWARKHFIDHVRATGPLPTIRIGKQPYGVLPVTSLNAWRAPAGRETEFSRDTALRQLLFDLREIWRRNLPEVPRLGRSDDTPQQSGVAKDLTEVLKMDGLSANYSIRNLLGRHYLEHLWIFLSADFFKDAWNLPEIEPPPEVEPPEIEEPPDGLRPAQRAAFIRAQREALARFEREQRARQQGFQRAVEARRNLLNGKRDAMNAWWAAHEQLTATALNTLRFTWQPRIANALFAAQAGTLDGPLVQAGLEPTLSPNYIETLLAARDLVKDIRFRNLSTEQPAPHTLLHLLLRHSMLLEYTDAATRLLIRRGLLPAEQRRELELVDLPLGQILQTVWRQMTKKIEVPGAPEPLELSKYLLGFLPSGEPDTEREPALKQISEFRASLGHLKSLSPAKLETLLKGTLDLCSHRLDAWITSIATKRLADIRAKRPNDVLYGGYGWVMNLTMEPQPAKVTPPPPGEQEPVFQAANNPGFVHAPSLTQASTVAILRSGHLAHAGADKQKPNDLLAIDLSSERVRLANWLLDGVRQGQPLGAVLGYRFERRLQETRAAEFITSFRELTPLVARKLEQPVSPTAVEAIAANNVVDGLALLRRWQKGKNSQPQQWTKETIPFAQSVGQQTIKLPPADPNNQKFKTLQAAFAVLEESVDAVSDALMAESMYQVVRGNPLRAANTVESIAGGEAPPPELEVVRTPRTGAALTFRLLTLFSGEPALPSGWAQPAHSFRADAEPHVNAWAAKLLGNPANVRCVIDRLDVDTRSVLESKELPLSELKLTPLDLVYAVEGAAEGQQAEIEQRILYHAVRMPNGFAPGSLLRINPKRKPEWGTTDLSYGEFSELLRTTRKLVTGVRPIDTGDLNPPDRSIELTIDFDELERRAAAARDSLTDTKNQFDALFAPAIGTNLERLRELILRSAAFGVAGAVPLSAAGDSEAEQQILTIQAASIRKELAQRLKQLEDLTSGFNAGDASAEARRDHAVAQLRIVFGKSFAVLPRFTASNADELNQALANSTRLQDGDPLAAATWFQRAARVRDGVARLNSAISYAEALNTGDRLKLTVAQLPHSPTDRWIGLPLKSGQNMPSGKVSLVVQSPANVDARQKLAGVLIDEWVEVVPNTTEITGLALQFDQPNAAPPQTILIAVPPQLETPWTTWSLQQVLLETLDLARVRAVDSEALDEVGHYLPALYFAFNALGETVSTDFTKIK